MALLMAVFALSQTRLVHAKNFLGPVTSGSDVVDTSDAVCTLREAMNAAFNDPAANDDCGTPSNSDTDVITFSGVTQVTLDSGDTELPNISNDNPNGVDLEIDGAGVTLDVNNIAFVVHDDAEFVLNGMTIINSAVASIQTDPLATVTLNNVDFTNNNKATNGGAIDNGGTMTINGGTFNGNAATADGGAIVNGNNATLTLNGVTFKNNTAGARGGAIANSGTLTINATSPATTFDTNSSTTQEETEGGGALFLDANSVTTIDGAIFKNNTADNGRGGAIYGGNFGAGTGSTISGSEFSGNQNSGMLGNSATNGDGGAFFVQGAWTVTNSYFHNNTALKGSGGAITVFSQGDLTMSNSTVSDNTAAESGSGISMESGTTTLTNVTVAANTDPLSGQLYSGGGTFTLRNTLIANPASGSNCSPSAGSFSDGGGNLQYPDSSCVSKTTGDPKLIGNASGFALGVGSAATDIGDESYCTSVAKDQVGNARSQDGNGDGDAVCDAGAQEGGTNLKPTANDDSYNVDEGQTLDIAAKGVLGNDTDPENAQLTAGLDADASNGQLTLNDDGSFSYKPNSGFKGDDKFTYHANDGASNSNTATVTITVKNVAPTAADDSFNVSTTPYIFDTSTLLANDTDAGGDNLTTSLTSNPEVTSLGGLVTQVGTTLTYVPVVNGQDSFTYTASDGTASSNTATVTLNVSSITNTPPTIIYAQGNQSININTDTGALPFTISDAETPVALLTVAGTSDNHTLVPDANVVIGGTLGSRTVTVTPVTGQTGTANITLTVSDGELTATASFMLTVSVPNTAPMINFTLGNQTIPVNTDTGSLAFTVGDTETPDSLTVTATSNNQTLVPDANIVLGQVDAVNRTVIVTPVTGQSGQATITLKVDDGALTATASFMLTVNAPGNTPPTISDVTDQVITQDKSTSALAFTVGDTETPDALTVTASSDNQTLVPDGNISLGQIDASHRTIMVTPASGQTGLATITIKVDDGTATVTDTFLLTVNAPARSIRMVMA